MEGLPDVGRIRPSSHQRWDKGDLPICRTGLRTSAEAWASELYLYDGNLSMLGASAPSSFQELGILLRGKQPLLFVDREQWSPLRKAFPKCDFRLVPRQELIRELDRNKDYVRMGVPHRAIIDARKVSFESGFAGKRLDLSVSVHVHVAELGQEPEVLQAVAEGAERVVFAGPEAHTLMIAYQETLNTSEHPAIPEARPDNGNRCPPTFHGDSCRGRPSGLRGASAGTYSVAVGGRGSAA